MLEILTYRDYEGFNIKSVKLLLSTSAVRGHKWYDYAFAILDAISAEAWSPVHTSSN